MKSTRSSELPTLRFRGGARHHLWLKAGTYYVRFSVVSGAELRFKAHRRVCISLRTSDLEAAIQRRDALLSTLPFRISAAV